MPKIIYCLNQVNAVAIVAIVCCNVASMHYELKRCRKSANFMINLFL